MIVNAARARARPLRRVWELQRLNLWQELQTSSQSRHNIKNTAAFIIIRFSYCNPTFWVLILCLYGIIQIDRLSKKLKLSGCTLKSRDAVTRRWTVKWIYSYSMSLWTHDVYSLMTNDRLHLLIFHSLIHSRTRSTPIARTRRKSRVILPVKLH